MVDVQTKGRDWGASQLQFAQPEAVRLGFSMLTYDIPLFPPTQVPKQLKNTDAGVRQIDLQGRHDCLFLIQCAFTAKKSETFTLGNIAIKII